MHRRSFIQFPAVAMAAGAATTGDIPNYHVVSPYKAAGKPNRFPGRVVSAPMQPTAESVAASIAASMKKLTGTKDAREAWRAFFTPQDVVGIKINCSGAPKIMSHPLVVGEIAKNLVELGIKPESIYLYERFENQVRTVNYQAVLPPGTQIFTMEGGDRRRAELRNYDPRVFVDVDFFGEEQTRSFLSRLVTEKVTKIIDVPNLKDHGASGVTGCLKNMAYGSFSNVARSHRESDRKTNTLSFIGTLYNTEPLRSKTVLHIMDGLKAVYQGGPFLRDDANGFPLHRVLVGTDPISLDRLMMDIIENKRKEMGFPSVWDRSDDARTKNQKGAGGQFIREPGHIEFAASLGLGVYDKSKISLEEISV